MYLAVFAWLGLGCGGGRTASGGDAGALPVAEVSAVVREAARERREENHIIAAFGAEPTQIDPTRTSAGVDQYFMTLFYEQLTTVDPDLERVNWLAESWDVREEAQRTVVDVRVRPGVRFHNGDELTAHDFHYAYTRQSDPRLSRRSGVWSYVDDVVVVDDLRFEIVFSVPDSSLISLNFEMYAVPRRYFEEVGNEGVQEHPIGTGPWKFVSRKPREEIVVERFDGYWNEEVRPSVERLTIKIIPEDTTRLAAFKTGAVDWIDAVPPAQFEEFEAMDGVESVSLQGGNNLFLAMNAIDPESPFHDVRVRQAVAHAIDIDAIVEYILYDQGIRTVQLAPGTLGYDPELVGYEFNPAKSRRLLASAGYPRGLDIPCYNLTTPREPYMKEVGEAMYAFLTAAGIRCRIVQFEYGAWINLGRRDARPEMDGLASWMWGQGLPGDPSDAWSGHLHSKIEGWGTYSYHADPELDLLVEAARTEMDFETKAGLVRSLARRKHDEVAGGLPTYRPRVSLAWRDYVSFRPWPSASWRSMREIGLHP